MDRKPHSIVALKRDRRRRVTTTAAQREEVLDAFERSGLKGREFAELAGVEPPLSPGFRWGGCGRVEKAIPQSITPVSPARWIAPSASVKSRRTVTRR